MNIVCFNHCRYCLTLLINWCKVLFFLMDLLNYQALDRLTIGTRSTRYMYSGTSIGKCHVRDLWLEMSSSLMHVHLILIVKTETREWRHRQCRWWCWPSGIIWMSWSADVFMSSLKKSLGMHRISHYWLHRPLLRWHVDNLLCRSNCSGASSRTNFKFHSTTNSGSPAKHPVPMILLNLES